MKPSSILARHFGQVKAADILGLLGWTAFDAAPASMVRGRVQLRKVERVERASNRPKDMPAPAIFTISCESRAARRAQGEPCVIHVLPLKPGARSCAAWPSERQRHCSSPRHILRPAF